MHQVFVCGNCGNQSQLSEEIELCEAKHMGLKTLTAKQEYDSLLAHVRSSSHIVSHTCNETTRKNHDDAIEQLLQFEKAHNMTTA